MMEFRPINLKHSPTAIARPLSPQRCASAEGRSFQSGTLRNLTEKPAWQVNSLYNSNSYRAMGAGQSDSPPAGSRGSSPVGGGGDDDDSGSRRSTTSEIALGLAWAGSPQIQSDLLAMIVAKWATSYGVTEFDVADFKSRLRGFSGEAINELIKCNKFQEERIGTLVLLYHMNCLPEGALLDKVKGLANSLLMSKDLTGCEHSEADECAGVTIVNQIHAFRMHLTEISWTNCYDEVLEMLMRFPLPMLRVLRQISYQHIASYTEALSHSLNQHLRD